MNTWLSYIFEFVGMESIDELYSAYIDIMKKHDISDIMPYDEFKLKVSELGTFTTTRIAMDWYDGGKDESFKRSIVAIFLYDNIIFRSSDNVSVMLDILESGCLTQSKQFRATFSNLLSKCIYYTTTENLYRLMLYTRYRDTYHLYITEVLLQTINVELGILKKLRVVNTYMSIYGKSAYRTIGMVRELIRTTLTVEESDIIGKKILLSILGNFGIDMLVCDDRMISTHRYMIELYELNVLKQLRRIMPVV